MQEGGLNDFYPDDQIPTRFIVGCEGDVKEARRRWDITRKWRETENLANILQEPQPHFFTIKKYLPHYHFGRGKSGNLVYYERPPAIRIAELKASGVTLDALYRHWLFYMEYQWNIILDGDETAKTIAVLDAEGLTVSFLRGEALAFVKKTIGIASQHYPERTLVVMVVNAPSAVSALWRVVKPWIHPNTQKKVRILSKKETLEGLQEHIDISQIPEYYGGQAHCDPPEGMSASQDAGNNLDSCRFYGPLNLAVDEYVRTVNANSSTLLSGGNHIDFRTFDVESKFVEFESNTSAEEVDSSPLAPENDDETATTPKESCKECSALTSDILAEPLASNAVNSPAKASSVETENTKSPVSTKKTRWPRLWSSPQTQRQQDKSFSSTKLDVMAFANPSPSLQFENGDLSPKVSATATTIVDPAISSISSKSINQSQEKVSASTSCAIDTPISNERVNTLQTPPRGSSTGVVISVTNGDIGDEYRTVPFIAI